MRCLLIGGAGPVGIALLHFFRRLGWTASVVDSEPPPHRAIHSVELSDIIEAWSFEKYSLEDLETRLRGESFDAVVDLTPTLDKRKSFVLCDALGVPLVNSTMVDYKDDIHIAAYNFIIDRPVARRRAHAAASGMNPGAINAMADEIIGCLGPPDRICLWEYDDTAPPDGVFREACTTWCQFDSHAEVTDDWTFEVLEEGTVLLHEDALSWPCEGWHNCGIPFDQVRIPPESDVFLIGHEECLYLGWRHDAPVKFVYGFHPENMKLIRSAGYTGTPRLLLQAPAEPLRGGDIVGVSCRYSSDQLWCARYCRLDNSTQIPVDTNATCMLVAAGIAASLMVLGQQGLAPGVYLTHEMPGWMKAFRSLVRVHECVVPDELTTPPADGRAAAEAAPALATSGG